MNVLAIDPGVKSGWAFWVHSQIMDAGEEDQQMMCRMIDNCAQSFDGKLHIVYESFHITPATTKKSFQPASLEIIGTIKYLANRSGCPIKAQTPTDAKRFSTDARLKALDWYTPTPGGHSNDAKRHLALFLAKNGETRHAERIMRAGMV